MPSAHEALATKNCATPGCDQEARHESGLCDRCDAEEAAKFADPPAAPRCKACSGPAPDAPKRGLYAGLCADCRAAKGVSQRKGARPAARTAKPAARSLAALGGDVEVARAELLEAEQAALDATTRYVEARDALRAAVEAL